MSQTENEIKQEHISVMGNELGNCYHQLWRELNLLYHRWFELKKLQFGEKDAFDTINETAPWFFKVAIGALWKEVIISIAAFGDPATTGKHTNMSINHLVELIPKNKEKVRLLEATLKVHATSAAIREFRNKKLAHWDYNSVIVQPTSIPPIQAISVELSLAAIQEAMQAVEILYFNSTTVYDKPFGPVGDARTVIRYVRLGKKLSDIMNDETRLKLKPR